MVARALWRSEALRVVPWLRPCTRLRLVSDQGTTLRASDLHNARATILNPFNNHHRAINTQTVSRSWLFHSLNKLHAYWSRQPRVLRHLPSLLYYFQQAPWMCGKEWNTKTPYCWPFGRGIHWLLVDSSHIGAVIRKAFPCHVFNLVLSCHMLCR